MDDEVFDDSMKLDPIKVAPLGKLLKVFGCLGRVLEIQLHHDATHCCVNLDLRRLGHSALLGLGLAAITSESERQEMRNSLCA